MNIICFVKDHVSKLASVDTLKSIAVDYSKGNKHKQNCEEVFGSIRR